MRGSYYQAAVCAWRASRPFAVEYSKGLYSSVALKNFLSQHDSTTTLLSSVVRHTFTIREFVL